MCRKRFRPLSAKSHQSLLGIPGSPLISLCALYMSTTCRMASVVSASDSSSSLNSRCSSKLMAYLSTLARKLIFERALPAADESLWRHRMARSWTKDNRFTSASAAHTSDTAQSWSNAPLLSRRSKNPCRINRGVPVFLRGKSSRPSDPSASLMASNPFLMATSSGSGPSQQLWDTPNSGSTLTTKLSGRLRDPDSIYGKAASWRAKWA
mmetsp:Transcript_2437/g.7121  ORF Transcript_2437/g.7121 Transcript_2437/m.7121 type:complete len:209 (-) Transcript_2437:9-635(-)